MPASIFLWCGRRTSARRTPCFRCRRDRPTGCSTRLVFARTSRNVVASPLPLVGEGGSPRSGETGEGLSPRANLSHVSLLKQPLIRRFAPPSPTRGRRIGSVHVADQFSTISYNTTRRPSSAAQ